MKVYFGAGIQGFENPQKRAERVATYKHIIDSIRGCGHEVLYEHTATNNREEAWTVLERQFGALPKDPYERKLFIRDKNLQGIEKHAEAAVFEVSTPSLGVGIEIAHAYLRPRLGIKAIPILALYQKDYWSHGLSVMVSGLQSDPTTRNFVVIQEFSDFDSIKNAVSQFLSG